MAAKTKAIDVGYVGTPGASALIGNAYKTQNDDRQALVEVVAEEHYLVAGVNTAKHGRHLKGAAVAYYENTEPTQQPSSASTGSTLSADDAGRLWVDADDADGPQVYVWSGTAWLHLQNVEVYKDGASTTTVQNLGAIINQWLLRTSEVQFAKVTASEFVGPLSGIANKIRTTAPSSPAAGDIWIA